MGIRIRLLTLGLLILPLAALPQTAATRASASSALIEAVRAKDGPRVSKMLKEGADPNAPAPDGQTPLHLAAGDGDVAVTLLLVTAGAKVNARDAQGLTPLHDAAAAGSRDVVTVLLAAGADPAAKAADGLTPSGEASRRGHQDVAQLLRSKEGAPAEGQQAGKKRSYTDSDLQAVRRTSRLANEGQLASAAPAATAASAPTVEEATGGSSAQDAVVRRAFEDGAWVEDIAAAQRFSKKGRHTILALFTGSDWCAFCKQLEAQVLSTAAFREAVRGKYLLLYVDLPRKKAVPKEVLAERNRFAQQFSVQAFPTMVVLEDGDRYVDRIRGFKQGSTKESYIAEIERIAPY